MLQMEEVLPGNKSCPEKFKSSGELCQIVVEINYLPLNQGFFHARQFFFKAFLGMFLILQMRHLRLVMMRLVMNL